MDEAQNSEVNKTQRLAADRLSLARYGATVKRRRAVANRRARRLASGDSTTRTQVCIERQRKYIYILILLEFLKVYMTFVSTQSILAEVIF